MAADDPFERRLGAALHDLLDATPPPHPTWAAAPAAGRVRGRPLPTAASGRGGLWLLAAALMVALVGSALAVAGGRLTLAPSPSPTLAVVVPPVSVSPSSNPTATAPVPTPSSSAVCSTTYALDGLPAVTQLTPVQGVSLSHGAGYDAIVFQFSSLDRVSATMAAASPPFVRDASGQPVTVAGRSFFRVTLRGVEGQGLPSSQLDATLTGPIAQELVEIGDFEGVQTWIVGVNAPTCLVVSALAASSRLVIQLHGLE